MSKRDQTAIVRTVLERGELCGRWAYLEGDIPNARTRAGEIAKRMGLALASELCKHREPGDSSYHDYRLVAREPKQLEFSLAPP